MKNAFINAQGVLTAWGFMEQNDADMAIPVPDDFSLQPGAWRWDGAQWTAYFAPLAWTAYQAQARAALDVSDVTILRCAENGVAVPAAWASYRKALRAIISAQAGDSTQSLPLRPEYPAGT